MSSRNKFFYIVILSGTFLIILSSCALRTAQDVRESESKLFRKATFIAQEHYETVYRIIINQARDCFHHSGRQGSLLEEVQGDLFPTKQYGVVMIGLDGFMQVRKVIDVFAIDEGQTKVFVYYYKVQRNKINQFGIRNNNQLEEYDSYFGQVVKEWVTGTSKECTKEEIDADLIKDR